MTAFRFSSSFAWRILLVLLLVGLASAVSAAFWGLHASSSEAGPLETGQLALLAATSILFALCALADQGAGRMSATVASVAALVLALREIELPVTGPVTAYLQSGEFRVHEMLVLGVPMLLYALLRPRHVREIVRFAIELRAWPVLPVLACVLLGSVFDGRFMLAGVPYLPTVIEETFELAGFAICFLAAVQVAVNLQHRAPPQLSVANRV